METYTPNKIESKWQKKWQELNLNRAADPGEPGSEKPKYYALVEFPYPSGAGLHVGHIRAWSGMDAFARKKRMQGYNVLFPMGWDAFGLPAENYALKKGVHPRVTTAENIATFKRQIQSLGLSFDWSREINTTDPGYYKWTQWIFLKLLEKGLAYQSEVPVNWCPFCKTNLADEEVLPDGTHERCGTLVEKRLQKQWLLAITKYADRLIDDLKLVDFPDKVARQQVNWIGRKEGAVIKFEIRNSKFENPNVEVFTTRADTLFGATFLVLAPEHRLAADLAKSGHNEVKKYVEAAKKKSEEERNAEGRKKTGVFSGIYATNPATGKEIPVWVADYVLSSYGTGAIMAVPAHDERDLEFAKEYKLPVVEVVEPVTGTPQENAEFRQSIVAVVRNPSTGMYLSVNWGDRGGNLFVGGGREKGEDVVETARREVSEETGYTNLKLISQTGRLHHNYFAHSKNVARTIDASAVLFELVDEKKGRTRLEQNEKGKFDVEWLSEQEAQTKVTDELHSLSFKLLVHNPIYTGGGVLANSGTYDGQKTEDARKTIVADLEKKDLAKFTVTYHLHDWIFSRQHYWGEPIPVVHCPKDGVVPVPEKDLPVELPYVEKYEPSGTGESPLSTMTDWVNTVCPRCGGPAKRETDTMPNWAGSNWYYLAYLFANSLGSPENSGGQNIRKSEDQKVRRSDPSGNPTIRGTESSENTDVFTANKELINYWLPVNVYEGGYEHTTLHLLYSRFIYKFLYDIGVVPGPEPYAARRVHGIVLGPDNRKMSKSFGNVINPDEIVEKFGADTLRMYEMFMGPFAETVVWNMNGVAGVYRFLGRVWGLFSGGQKAENGSPKVRVFLSRLAKKTASDLENMKFNTAVSSLMEFMNDVSGIKEKMSPDDWDAFARILAPLAPHLAEEMYQRLRSQIPDLTDKDPGFFQSVHEQPWPDVAVEESVEDMDLVIQVNGKVREVLKMSLERAREQAVVQEAALGSEKVKKHLNGKDYKVVFVPGRLINFVTTG